MQQNLFDRAHLDHLKTALTVYSRRQRVTAENIANVETKGYKAQEYKFEEMLRKAQGNNVVGRQSRPGHLPIGRQSIGQTNGEVRARDNGFDNGINDVNVDQEMTDIATNELSYRLATRVLSMKYNVLRESISGRIR